MDTTDANEATATEPSPAKPHFPIQPDIDNPGRSVAVAPGRLVFHDRDDPSRSDPPDFTVYRASTQGWVTRAHSLGRDFPFHSREAAIAAVNRILIQPSAFVGAASDASVYGEPGVADTVLVYA